MKKEAELEIPKYSETLNKDEMGFVDGGVSVKVARSMLNKNNCYNMAAQYLSTGMTQRRIAIEIYAHAKCYYGGTAFLNLINSSSGGKFLGRPAIPILEEIVSHSNPIDLGHDSDFRVFAFEVIWKNF
ncbi:MAG: hypothetical protein LBQ95_02020 [Lachnospiraceae bacterium]|jgi:hypothetical protein|nr:hypothetical protein [Lachnospiraceae bacterium]